MACPYFIPIEVLAGDLWPHRPRLPLGDGFTGTCCVQPESPAAPSEEELRQFCNLGYAAAYSCKCPRFPESRDFDAIRVGVVRDDESTLSVAFACERDFVAIDHGNLVYDCASGTWTTAHPDPRVQSKAEAYVRTYLLRRPRRHRADTQRVLVQTALSQVT